jgi:SNF2 family DNA or RNA helicase
MQLELDQLGGTPVFRLRGAGEQPWGRVLGAVLRDDGCLFPAYSPLGAFVLDDLRTLEPNLPMTEAAAAHAELLREENRRLQRIIAGSVEPELPAGHRFHVQPYDHQLRGLAMAQIAWRWAFAWEMGTGKTKTLIEAFRVWKVFGQMRRVLVLAPRVVIPTWLREIEKHAGGELRALHWETAEDDRREEARQADIVLATYAATRIEATKGAREDPLKQMDFDVIVADESHSLGNWGSQQTKAGVMLSVGRPRRYALSGTLADDPRKVYPQLRFLVPGLVDDDYQRFLKSHVVFHPAKKYLAMRYVNLDRINQRVDRVCHRLKKEECLDLPPMQIVDQVFAMRPEQVSAYNERIMQLRALRMFQDARAGDDAPPQDAARKLRVLQEIAENPSAVVTHAATLVNKLRQITSGFLIKGADLSICDACPRMKGCVGAKIRPYTPSCEVAQEPPAREVFRYETNAKLELLEHQLRTILEESPGNKVIIWAAYDEELDDLSALCRREKWGHVRLDGKTTKKVAAIEDAFWKDPAVRVCVGQIRVGVGINLSAANYAIYYTLTWDRVQYRQSLDRNHRPGQTRPTTTYRLLAADTLDEYVAASISRKDQIAFTLVEKIACAGCPEQRRCARDEVKPFFDGCIYKKDIDRPIAKIETIPEDIE